jgi:hypothetical protein
MSPRDRVFLWTAPVIAVQWLLLVVLDPDAGSGLLETLSIGFFLGTMLGQTTLAAAWAPLGPGPLVWRLPLSLIWLALLALGLTLNLALHRGPPGDFVILMGLCLLGQWVLLQFPLWGLALGYGIHLRHADDALESDRRQRQFGIRQLIIVTAIVGVTLGLGRMLVARFATQIDLGGRYCWAGLDLSSTQDITALVLVFRDENHYSAIPFFWVPEEGAMQRARRDRVPYTDWIDDGYITATPGEVIDYERIRAKINELGQQYQILEIAVDRWNATQLATQLTDDGFEMVAFGQGYASMNWPTKKLEEVMLAQRLSHGGHPVLRWMAGNVSIETDAVDNWKPSKKKSRERIDGIVALIMALDRASRQEEFTSVYDKRGPLFITLDDDPWKSDR